MVNSQNNHMKTKLQEEQDRVTSLQKIHNLCENKINSMTENVDSMLTKKHNLNVQLMELTDKLNKSQSDLVNIREKVEQANASEQKHKRLVPAKIVGSPSSQEENTEEVQTNKKNKLRR